MIYFILTGLIGGFFSGFMGIGGGLIMVPFLVFFAKFSQHLAQGTSLAVLTIPVVAIGAFNYYQNGNVDIKIIDKYGPDGISNLIKILSNKAVKFQSGYIYQYALIMLLGFSVILTYIILT